MNRLQRAWMFLRSARTENFLPIKISFYMSLLEALFLSQGTEISHKLGERTALFLGGDTESKIKNYDIIKSAYDIRSKFMHGDILKKTNESLINISTNVDSLIRKILIKAINEESNLFKLNQEDFEGYFKKILFN